MASIDLSNLSWNQLAIGFNDRIAQPLAEKIANNIAVSDVYTRHSRALVGQQLNAQQQDEVRQKAANLTPILAYDIKAMTFNVATVFTVAYAAFALMGGMTVVTALIWVGGSYVIRRIAEESMPKEFKLTKYASALPDYFTGEAKNPESITYREITLLKFPNLSLLTQAVLMKRAVFG
jgi:hypothetical protein